MRIFMYIFLDASACLDVWTHGCLPECVYVRSCSCGCKKILGFK